jgi:hypothetical protein
VTLLAPWFLAAAGLAALGVVALHLIAVQRPPEAPLPTARFVPDAPARARSRTPRPTDRWLLLLRVLAVLLAGLAFARPVREPERQAVRRVLVVDRSRAVGSAGELRDSVAAWLRPGDALVLFDTAARAVPRPAAESLATLTPSGAPARLSAGLVAGLRAAAAVRDSTDSLELVLVSPLAREGVDAATLAVRREWPALVHLVRVRGATDSAGRAIDARVDASDPLAVAAAGVRGGADARLVRAAGAADSAFARAGGMLLVWPDSLPTGWSMRAVADTVGAVVAGDASVVAPFPRAWQAPAGVAPARWVDGAPAALETPLGRGCVRTVGVPVADAGDLVLRPAFRRFVTVLAAPCGGARDLASASEELARALRGSGAARAAARGTGGPRASSLAPWLLGAAILLLLGEPLLRRARGARA